MRDLVGLALPINIAEKNPLNSCIMHILVLTSGSENEACALICPWAANRFSG